MCLWACIGSDTRLDLQRLSAYAGELASPQLFVALHTALAVVDSVSANMPSPSAKLKASRRFRSASASRANSPPAKWQDAGPRHRIDMPGASPTRSVSILATRASAALMTRLPAKLVGRMPHESGMQDGAMKAGATSGNIGRPLVLGMLGLQGQCRPHRLPLGGDPRWETVLLGAGRPSPLPLLRSPGPGAGRGDLSPPLLHLMLDRNSWPGAPRSRLPPGRRRHTPLTRRGCGQPRSPSQARTIQGWLKSRLKWS